MIFAIGCRHYRLTDHANSDVSNNHLLLSTYFTLDGVSKFVNIALHSAISLEINLRILDERIDYASKEALTGIGESLYLVQLLTLVEEEKFGELESQHDESLPYTRERVYLVISYYSARITLYRLYLRKDHPCETIYRNGYPLSLGVLFAYLYLPGESRSCLAYAYDALVECSLFPNAIYDSTTLRIIILLFCTTRPGRIKTI
ncbi:hypothetical protein N7507_007082 [Penicillium longicatenatum]|nr:hypothetical protein N7507_007082 [Penicillium longicatenatum]